MRRLSMFRHEIGLGLLTILLLVLVTSAFPRFLAIDNVKSLLDDSALLVMMSIGEMLVLLTRGVDLSIAANAAFTGMVVALFNAHDPQAGLVPVLIFSVLIGACLGLFNGLLIWKLRIPSIVVTLGTLSIYRGLVYLVSGGAWVNSGEMSPAFQNFVRCSAFGISVLTYFALAMACLAFWFLKFTNTGRNFYAAGNNPAAASYAGIDVGRLQCLAFLLSGMISGLCGYFWVARFAVAYTEIASGFELQVIAACVIGGISITGGVGTVAGLVLGGLFLSIIKNALPVVGISPFFQLAVSGLVITVTVVINSMSYRRTHSRKILEAKEVVS